jgi:rhamnogalacturonyl hydrolase YesR
VTTFCGEALLAAYQVCGKPEYLKAAREASRYLLEDLPVLEETTDRKCIGYVTAGLRWRVINVNAVIAGFLSKLYEQTGDPSILDQAGKLIRWVISERTPDDTWNYTSPKNQSGIGPDNYHTGGILDGIFDYFAVSGEDEVRRIFQAGLVQYERRFFTAEGAPRWREHRDFPHDIHGAAQGIITFTRARSLLPSALETARRIAGWALTEMQDPKDGHFYYQKYRYFTWKIDLMRWNNSWMFWALGELLSSMAKTVGQSPATGTGGK